MRTATYLIAPALLVLVCQVCAEERKEASLLGAYKVVRCEKDGKEESAEHLKNMKVQIDRAAITWWKESGEKPSLSYYQLNTSEKPWRIQVTMTDGENAGRTAMGILEREGDTVKICLARPGEQAPTSFRGDQQHKFLVLEKMQADNTRRDK